MKVVFVSNFLSSHQQSFVAEMYKKLGKDFVFVSNESYDLERTNMGWKENNVEYNIRVDNKNKKDVQQLIYNADVVIIGSAPDSYIRDRLKSNKLTFKYSERSYKKGIMTRFKPRAIIGEFIHHTIYQKKPLYMLCSSAYTSYDHSLWKNYINKCYKWGYFPKFNKYNVEVLMESKKHKVVEILWVGRMLAWKHPEYAVYVAKYLQVKQIPYHMTIIGEGEKKESISNFIHNKNLENNITLLNFIPIEDVRSYMEKANIFMFTSDFNEGWGAVLNEAMNSACAVVASHAIGSVPFLVKHEVNGLIYKYGDIEGCCKCVENLVVDKNYTEKLGMNAYETIATKWNAENAADELINLVSNLLEGKNCIVDSGPCSKAEIIKEDWFDEK